ncbi:MAG: putative toxin-antitoxin system toxin component, PIN family [Anaerolineae bacterium]|nr:putative toxin-antitoxin system toxin component, PIN family [Anaerolineae bacterium]
MIRILVDTNILVSGSLWGGLPAKILFLAQEGEIELITSEPLIAEYRRVISREKNAERLTAVGETADSLIVNYQSVATVVQPAEIEPVILNDPPDDAVLACALGGKADIIVSGNRHLLNLSSYQSIPIMTASGFLELMATSDLD